METASVSDRNKKFRGFGRILSMFHRRFFEDCKTTYIVTKEGQPFQWIKKVESFQELKTRMPTALVLILPDSRKGFHIYCDAS